MEPDISQATTPQYVKLDKNTAICYRVVQEKIDLGALRQEKKNLEAQLEEKEPPVEQLIAMAKFTHPFYQRNLKSISERITEIGVILNG